MKIPKKATLPEGYLLVALLSFFLFTIFLLFFHQFYYQSYTDRSFSVLQLSLSNLQKDTDHMLELEHMRIDEFYRSSNVQNLIALGNDASDEKHLLVEQGMNGLLENSSCYDQAVLRIRDSETTLTAGLGTNSWYADPDAWSWAEANARLYGIEDDGRMWLRYDFPASRPLASLQLYISQKKLYAQLFCSPYSMDTYLYTADGIPVLDERLDYPQQENFAVIPLESKEDIYQLMDSAFDYVAIARSQVNNWILLHPVNSESLTTLMNVIQVLYPYLLGLTFVILVGLLGIAVYNRRLRLAQREKEQYGRLLTHVMPQVELQVLSDWLTSPQADGEAVRRTLSTVNSKFGGEGTSIPLLLRWQTDVQATENWAVLDSWQKAEIREFIQEFWKEDIYFPETGKREITILLRANDASSGGLKQRCDIFLRQLALFSSEKKYDVFAAEGMLCHSLEEVRDSWQDIRRAVELEKYLRNCDSALGDGQPLRVTQIGKEDHLAAWVDGVLSQNVEVTEEILLHCQYESEDGQDTGALVYKLLDRLVERLLGMQAKGSKAFFRCKAEFGQRFSEEGWTGRCGKALEELFNEAARTCGVLEKREQY